ncbi:MAG: hypothetical protein A2W93_02635 [Bacteroidetes bacterium GWF2_43_63]|nr:MAG: hypothetical protein A2W94_08645 [Bacteroidetes bacterium GWE2_42_42]OFY53566.1 MAG: hypothetical protein A2W93_02635 [Bacteroidetes bacterium GWF2_43_63]HBG71103.1 hypothetical protein [Bacteroidales bacterium]HCB63680.1 hypothetical protein [Bacteroidales bacterium]
MKKIFLFLSVISVVVLNSCKGDREPEMKVLTDRIEYDVMVNNDGKMDPIMNHVNEDVRVEFIHFLFEELKNGKAFSDSGATTDSKSVLMLIRELFPDADTTVSDPEVYYKLNTAKINKLRFREKWVYNSENFKIEKTVLAVAPLIELADTLGYVYKAVPLFWIQCDTAKDLKEVNVLSTNIITDALVYNQLEMILYLDSTPADFYCNLKNPAKTEFFDALLASVIDKKVTGYNFFFNPLEEADMRVLKGYSDTLTDYDENNKEVRTIIEHKISAKEFGRIKFAERWEYSSNPFIFRKTVMALNPSVIVVDPQYNVVRGFKPLFWTVYDEKYLQEMKGKVLQ